MKSFGVTILTIIFFSFLTISLNNEVNRATENENFVTKVYEVSTESAKLFSNQTIANFIKTQKEIKTESQFTSSAHHSYKNKSSSKRNQHFFPGYLVEERSHSTGSFKNYNYNPRAVYISRLHSLRNDVNQKSFPPPQTYMMSSEYDSYKMSPRSYSPLARSGELLGYTYPFQGNLVFSNYLSNYVDKGYSKCARSYHTTPQFREQDMVAAFEFARQALHKHKQMESQQFESGYFLNASVISASSRHLVHHVLKKYSSIYFKEEPAQIMEYATLYLTHNYCLTPLEVSLILPSIKIPEHAKVDPICKKSYNGVKGFNCVNSKYRSIDGKCNNLYFPDWGSSFSCQQRLLPPAYKDGISMPRTLSVTGQPLPTPRSLSNFAHPDVIDYSFYSLLKMLWGQFLNHDIISTSSTQFEEERGIKCCPVAKHPQCLPIYLDKEDYQMVNFNRTCMNMVRSAPCPLCTLGPRQQINADTSFIDASPVYGSTADVTNRLRYKKYGMLRMNYNSKGALILPTTKHPQFDQCLAARKELLCFDAGDERVNQHPGLMVIHTLLARRHNKHAYHLSLVNRNWDDEKLFQEARKILIAELQHVTYNEYLPSIFGPVLTEFYKFKHREYNGFSRYDPYINPSIINEYAAAAGRFGHSSIISYHKFEPLNKQPTLYNNLSGYNLRDMYFDPTLIHENYMDAMIKGYLTSQSSEVDPYLTQDIKNYLYKVKDKNFGNDLGALNVQRGRDHGLPPYYVFAEFCFGYQIKSWEDVSKFIPNHKVQLLRSIYRDFKDVDLFTGGMHERKSPDADFGPIFTCINGIQFNHLKYGDRYFYSHGNETGSFTPGQLENILSTVSLSSILCKSCDSLQSVQPHSFFLPSSSNVPKQCEHYPEINYSLWKEV